MSALNLVMPFKAAARISKKDISNQDVATCILLTMFWGAVVFYGAFTESNPAWTKFSALEAVCILLITAFGFVKCYDAAGGDNNNDFAKEYAILKLGCSIWSAIIIWSVYWSCAHLFRKFIEGSFDVRTLKFNSNLVEIGLDLHWFVIFMITLVWQALYFLLLYKAFSKVAR